MLDEAQVIYLQEVLGVSAAVVPRSRPRLVVWTDELNSAESALLMKILAAAKLEPHSYTHVQGELAQMPIDAHQVLAFTDRVDGGRWVREQSVWWGFPSLHQMNGASPEVAEVKRRTWALLQQFGKEER